MSYEKNIENAARKVLIAGDSTGVGTGASDPKYSIAGRIGSDYPGTDIKNISENGLKIGELSKKLLEMKDENFDLIIYQIGANDVVGFTPLETISEQLNELLQYAENNSKKTIVVTAGNIGLSKVFSWPISTLVSNRTLKVRKIFMDNISKYENIEYIDFYREKEEDPFSKNYEKYYAKDFFHPSDHGYEFWYKKIKEKISFD